MKKIFLSILCVLAFNFCRADSPLTSTEFYKAYIDLPQVQLALKTKGRICQETLKYIATATTPLDVKLAIINAIGWSNNGTQNSRTYMNYILKTKKYKSGKNSKRITFLWHATADELICFAYILAMENYFDVTYANSIAEQAVSKNPNSYVLKLFASLIKAQGLCALNEWCYAVVEIKNIEQNTDLNFDLKTQGKKIISDYINSIDANCN